MVVLSSVEVNYLKNYFYKTVEALLVQFDSKNPIFSSDNM